MIALIALMILNGIMSSTRFEYDFKTQQEDHVVGNYLCPIIFGDRVRRRWGEFKLCVSLVDSRVTMP